MSNSADLTLSRAERKQGQKFALFSNMFANITMYVTTGALMMLYAGDVLGLPPAKISRILALIPLVSMIRILLLPFMRRLGKVFLLRLTTLLQWAIILAMVIMPPTRLTYALYLVLLIAFSLIGQLGAGIVWQPLLRDITTVSDRGRFFSRMRFVFTLVNLSVTGVIPLVIGESITSGEYKIFLSFLLVTHLIRFFLLRKIPEIPPRTGKKLGKVSLRAALGEFKTLRIPLLIQLLTQISFFPVIVLYLRQNLNLPADVVTLAVFSGTVGNALSLLIWGTVSDTVGFKNMLGGVHLLGLIQAPLLFFILPGAEVLSPGVLSLVCLFLFMFLNGLIMSGSGIGTTSIQHYFTTNENSFTVLNLYACMALLVNSGWTFFTGSLLESPRIPGADILSSPVMHLDGVKIFLLTVPLLVRFVLLFFLRKLPNIKPWFGLGDFFTSLNPHSLRTMVITNRLHRMDDRSRDRAVRLINRYTTPLGVHSLTELLKDPSYDVKISVIRELGRSGSPLAGEKLMELLRNNRMAIYHEHVIWALGELSWEDAAAPLTTILSSERSEKVKAEAARALGKIGKDAAVPQLAVLLDKETPSLHLSSSACRALIALAPEECALDIFRVLPRYGDNNIRYEIMAALCPFLEISDRWLLKYGQDQGAYRALLEEVENRSDSWKRENSAIIGAVRKKDYRRITELYADRYRGTKPVTVALKKSLPAYDRWNQVILLAAARLLLH